MNFNLKILATALFIFLTNNNLFGAENQASNIMILFSCNVYGETDPCG